MKKETAVKKQNGVGNLKILKNTYLRYVALSKYLFATGDDAIYDVNEIPKGNEFYKLAKGIAKDLDINWKEMTHEESNRIMLAMLEDTYNAMAEVSDKEKLIIEIKLKILK